MTVDQGGLRYPITAENQFSPTFAAFRRDLAASRLEYAKFKREIATGFSREGVDEAARAARDAAREQRRLTTETQRNARQTSIAERAQKRYAREVTNAAVSQERDAIAKQRNFALDRRVLNATQARARAERDIARVVNRRLVQEQRFAIAKQRSLNLTEKEAVTLGLASRATIKLTAEQRRLQRAKDRLAQASELQNSEELLRLEAERRAVARITRERLKQLEIQALDARGFDASGRPQPQDERRQLSFLQFLRQVGRDGEKANRQTNRLSFTFRRLFGILAAFAAARFGVTIFAGLLRESVRVNAAIETTEIGLAALLASVADLRGVNGEQLDAQNRLNVAQGISRDLIRQIRLDSLATTATFQELADTVQVGLAPGLRAGLRVEEVGDLARDISIAATTLGLEQRQLSEEIRALFTGAIRQGQSRIANALGITPEDVRTAIEAGNLYEVLRERLEGFNAAGERAARTFEGLRQRVAGAVQELFLAGGSDLFITLKDVLEDIFNSIVSIDEITGQLVINEDLVEIVEQISEGIADAVRSLRGLSDGLDVSDFQEVAALVGDIFRVTALIGGPVIQGIVLGLRDISRVLGVVREVLEIFGFASGAAREIVVQLTRAATVFFTLSVIGGTILATSRLIAFTWRGVLVTVKAVQISFVAIRSTMVTLSAISSALVVKVNGLAAAIGLAAAPALGLAAAFIAAAASVALMIRELKKLADGEDTLISTQGALALRRTQLTGVDAQIRDANRGFNVRGNPVRRDEERLRRLREQRSELVAQINLLEKDADAAVTSFKDGVEENINAITSKFRDIVGAITGDLEDVGETAEAELGRRVQGILLDTSSAAEQLRDRLRQIKDEARQEFAFQAFSVGLTGVEQEIRSSIEARARAEIQAAEQTLAVRREIEKAERSISDLKLEAQGLDTEADAERLDIINGTVAALEGRLSELNRLAQTTQAAAQALASGGLLSSVQDSNFEQRQEVALQRIAAARERAVLAAEQEGDVLRAREAVITAEIQTLEQAEARRLETFNRTNTALQQQIDLIRAAIAPLEQLEAGGDLLPEQSAQLDSERALISQYEIQLQLLREQKIAADQLAETERQRLAFQQQLNEAAQENPLAAGFVSAFIQANDEVNNLFQTTVTTLRSAITGFSQFIAQSIVDAFDPTSDQSIQERFARFLQQIATQVIATLVQLAITALVLNAASGGLLGPLVGGLVQARPAAGLAEGGNVGEADRRRHRAQQRRDRSLTHMRARGYAEGGSPGTRRQHGVARPSGLDRRDTVPIWAAMDEWMIRGSSVAKAGVDAIERINKGWFSADALRAAVGLGSNRMSSTALVSRTRGGLAAGGAVSSVDTAVDAVDTGGGSAAPIAVTVASEEKAERNFRGGRKALLRELAGEGITP